MKIISEKQVHGHLVGDLNKDSITNYYQKALLNALRQYEQNPAIVPPRTIQKSATDDCDTTHLYMPCTAPHSVGFKVISGGSINAQRNLGFQGCVVTIDEYTGIPKAVVNAKTLTAFRTALATSLGLSRVVFSNHKLRVSPNLTVFGSGPQAFWHAILALRLMPLESITVVSRSRESAERLAGQLREHAPKTEVTAFGLGHTEEIRQACQKSSVIFGCTPSTAPIIQNDFLNGDAQMLKFVGLVGSYKPHMMELDQETMQEIKLAGTKIVVDSVEHTAAEAGEFIQNGIPKSQLEAMTSIYASDDTLHLISATGLVLCKVVGLLIMDIAMANLLAHTVAVEECDFE